MDAITTVFAVLCLREMPSRNVTYRSLRLGLHSRPRHANCHTLHRTPNRSPATLEARKKPARSKHPNPIPEHSKPKPPKVKYPKKKKSHA